MPESLECPDPLRDTGRLAVLQRIALLDSPPDPAFDRLTRLAATVLGAPIALMSLVDSDRQFFKSAFGLPEPWRSQRQTPLSHSICRHVVAAGQPLVIEDTREHPMTRDNRAVIELGLIAYLGIPLITPGGYTLGSLCVLDTRPRTWSAEQIEILADLAASVLSEIKLIARAKDHQGKVLVPAGEGTLGLCRSGRCTFINPVAAGMLGYAADEIVGQQVHDLIHRDPGDTSPLPEDICLICRASQAHRPVQVGDQELWRRDGTSFRVDYAVYPVIQNGIATGTIATFVDTATRQRARQVEQTHQQAPAEAETELNQLQRLVTQSPIICYLAGPEHFYTFANSSYKRVIGGRDPTGKPLREVLPEIESQGFIALLDRVFTTGEPFTGIEMPVLLDRRGDGTLEECLFTFIYQPDFGPDGKINGIAVYGFEVTEQVQARQEAETPFRLSAERMAVLAEVSHQLAEAAFDQQAILDTAARSVANITGDTCAIRLLSDDQWLFPAALYHSNPGILPDVRAWLTGPPLPVDEEHSLWMARSSEPLLIPGYTPEKYRATIGSAASFIEQLGTQSILVMPLRAQNQVIGLISVLRDALTSPFTIDEQRFLQVLADRIGLAILNARLYEQLGAREQQCQDLVGRLLLAQEEERRRIAFELHEDLAQIAASAYQHLQAYTSRLSSRMSASDELDHTAELMRRTIQEARRIVSELRPTVLDDFGLPAAVRLHVEEWQAQGWQIDYRESTGIGRLPTMVETVIFRVIQEALENVRKHAKTTRVDILLERADQSIRMEVRDWGRGFAPEVSSRQQVGLASIRAWVAFLGGQFVLDSQPGGGTRIMAEVPL